MQIPNTALSLLLLIVQLVAASPAAPFRNERRDDVVFDCPPHVTKMPAGYFRCGNVCCPKSKKCEKVTSGGKDRCT
ncbi:Protein of unknown function [Pyronema omphalodes CBS 100304]|uniref:Uncharacterized protein n=1 Tax=Pyronema omphalodes (strain CBS 100304) TaxID=1076935 RepID=U4LT48_PYROM|nr:Protein of unknown function [Pyronema omphalodes CBS 100304]